MDAKARDHAYHRSRVDAQIGGSIGFVLLMLALALLVGDKFQPLQQGADPWSSTLLVWQANTNAWIPLQTALQSQPDLGASRAMVTKEIYPGSYFGVVALGSLGAAYFLYSCARRQARLMAAVYAPDDPQRPYDRPWSEVRVTFWGLFAVLLGVLFLFAI